MFGRCSTKKLLLCKFPNFLYKKDYQVSYCIDIYLFLKYRKHTPCRRQSKTLILSTNIDQKSLETEFLITICRPTGDKWQSKTLFLAIFDPRLSIVKSIFDCRLPGVRQNVAGA